MTLEFKCRLPECGKIFPKKYNLERHIKGVHEKERPHVCSYPECSAAFLTTTHLKRHVIRSHTKERPYKCSECAKCFVTSDVLRLHLISVHGKEKSIGGEIISVEKPHYECAECGSSFNRRSAIVRHISDVHNDYFEFKCDTCKRKFKRKSYVKQHILKSHLEKNRSIPVKHSAIRCIFCKESYEWLQQVHEHYKKIHDIDLFTEKLEFPTVEEFYTWKKEMEDSTVTRFRIRVKSKYRRTYICHRSGLVHVKSSDRKRANRVKGSKKLDGECPASITLRLNKNKSCTAVYTQTHLGHQMNDENELKFIYPRKEDRQKYANMIATPKRRILNDQIKDSDELFDACIEDGIRTHMFKPIDAVCTLENEDAPAALVEEVFYYNGESLHDDELASDEERVVYVEELLQDDEELVVNEEELLPDVDELSHSDLSEEDEVDFELQISKLKKRMEELIERTTSMRLMKILKTGVTNMKAAFDLIDRNSSKNMSKI